jgi:hypothetical protein
MSPGTCPSNIHTKMSLGCFPDHGRDDAGNSAQFWVNAKYSCLSSDTEDRRKGLFAFHRDRELNEPSLPSGCYLTEFERRGAWRSVEQDDAGAPISHVKGHVNMAGLNLLPLLTIHSADGHIPHSINKGVRGLREKGTVLNVVIADEVKGRPLREDGRFVVY